MKRLAVNYSSMVVLMIVYFDAIAKRSLPDDKVGNSVLRTHFVTVSTLLYHLKLGLLTYRRFETQFDISSLTGTYGKSSLLRCDLFVSRKDII